MVSQAAGSESLDMHTMSNHPEPDELFSEFNADQVDIQSDNPAKANTKGKEKQQKCIKLIDQWLMHRETYCTSRRYFATIDEEGWK